MGDGETDTTQWLRGSQLSSHVSLHGQLLSRLELVEEEAFRHLGLQKQSWFVQFPFLVYFDDCFTKPDPFGAWRN